MDEKNIITSPIAEPKPWTDEMERMRLLWHNRALLIEALDRRLQQGLIEVDREQLADGTVRATYRGFLP